MLEDLEADADIEDLVDPAPLLDLVIAELLVPALLDDDPMPLLLLSLPVVVRRGVWIMPPPWVKNPWS